MRGLAILKHVFRMSVIIIILLLPFRGCFSTQGLSTEAPEIERLILLLEQYKNDQGKYPSKLDQLRPDYTAQIPIPDVVSELNYVVDEENNSWQLIYTDKFGSECTFWKDSLSPPDRGFSSSCRLP